MGEMWFYPKSSCFARYLQVKIVLSCEGEKQWLMAEKESK
jgi:hypothetical protein